MGWDGKERRAKKRYALPECTVRFSPGSALAFLRPYSGRYLLTNLGEGGIGFMTGESLRQGELLRIQVESPHLPRGWTCKGRVAWAKKSEREEAWRVGLAILKISESSAALLKHLLDKSLLEKQEVSTSLFLKKIKRL